MDFWVLVSISFHLIPIMPYFAPFLSFDIYPKMSKNAIFGQMLNDKNGAKYGNMGIKWTDLIRQIDIRTQKSILMYNTWQKIWKYYECHFSYVFWWKKRVFQRRVFLIIEEAKKNFPCYTYALEWGQQQCPCKF